MGSATTATARLWRMCSWLIAAAKSRGRLTEAQHALKYLIDLLNDGQPLPGQPEHDHTTPVDDGTPWYVRVRATARDRRDDVA